MTSTKTISISKDFYDSLIKDSEELQALHDGGVDNWEWYHESLEEAGFIKKYYENDDD